MRVVIYFTDKSFQELKDFLNKKYAGKNAMSLTVEEAVKEYLKHQDKS